MRHDEVVPKQVDWIFSMQTIRGAAPRSRIASIYLSRSLLDATRRVGAKTIPGAVKSRKARKLTPPRKQRLPQIRCKRWRHDDAPRAVARDDINMLLM